MSVATIGIRLDSGPRQELTAERASVQRAAHIAQFVESMPGNNAPPPEPRKKTNAAAADMERISLAFNKRLQFVVDHQSDNVIVKVIDTETDKVIKVLPPEELQRLHTKLKETIGFLFDQRV